MDIFPTLSSLFYVAMCSGLGIALRCFYDRLPPMDRVTLDVVRGMSVTLSVTSSAQSYVNLSLVVYE